jgi:uncharacterized lipoprotein YehR (DUF1307 family)
MKPLKVTILAIAMIMAVSFTACGNDKDAKAPESTANSTSELPSEVQPGAKVERRINEDGNEEFSYQNPDGSAGGGVELD